MIKMLKSLPYRHLIILFMVYIGYLLAIRNISVLFIAISFIYFVYYSLLGITLLKLLLSPSHAITPSLVLFLVSCFITLLTLPTRLSRAGTMDMASYAQNKRT